MLAEGDYKTKKLWRELEQYLNCFNSLLFLSTFLVIKILYLKAICFNPFM